MEKGLGVVEDGGGIRFVFRDGAAVFPFKEDVADGVDQSGGHLISKAAGVETN